MSEATSGNSSFLSPHIAEPVIGRPFAPPVGSCGLSGALTLASTERFLALRATTNLSSQINLIPPVQPLLQKYFSSRTGRSSNRGIAVPHPSEGRFAIVTDVGWGMRWTWSRQATNDVDSRTAKSCGSDSSTLESNRRRCLRIAPVTVTRKPDRREEREGSR
jgi:hypothetical protein